jgi:thioredoxin reductase (NADPH)
MTPVAAALSGGPRLFPIVSEAQLERLRVRGSVRYVPSGEVLTEVGDRHQRFFVVLRGALETLRTADRGTLVAKIGPGQFTGEVNVLADRHAIFRTVAVSPTTVIELDRAQLRAVVELDADLGELIVGTFLLRRADLVAAGVGNIVVAGSIHSAGTHRMRQFLVRNGQSYRYIDLDRDADTQWLLDVTRFGPNDVPIVICNGAILRDPTIEEVARRLGLDDVTDVGQVRDLVVVGAGPAGLAAAVYGASEGLDVLVVDAGSLGGQAGSTSRIENYLGFPSGISGQDLANRAFTQAAKFGAKIMMGGAVGLQHDRPPYGLAFGDGTSIRCRAMVIASGVSYRKPDIAQRTVFEGAGVYYAATMVEAEMTRGADVIIVGGGNSAGQAAVFLSQTARRVRVLVRSKTLSSSMSRYLSRRIEEVANIDVLFETRIEALLGDDRLTAVRCRSQASDQVAEFDVQHVFLMTGGVPNTGWLNETLALDERRFIKTGPALSADDLSGCGWALPRSPFLLETSLPGVFAAGDVRGGNVKRVAAAVGEGSSAISYVLQHLQE